MMNGDRRQFLEMAGTLTLVGLMAAGCKTMETLEGNVTSIIAATGNSSISQKANLFFNKANIIERCFTDFTPEQEYYIGRTVGAQLLGKYPPYNNAQANNYINLLGQTLAAASDMPETFGGYHFLVQNSDDINAFAAPGGLIFITRGMIRCCDDEDAFAAVLAHEIGHIRYRHGIQAIKQSRVTEIFTTLGIESTKQFGSEKLVKLVDLFEKSISDITHTLITDGYSRSSEKQADQAAVTLLERVGYAPASLVSMLRKMETKLIPGRHDFSQTHPRPGTRIKYINKMIGSHAAPSSRSEARDSRFKRFLSCI